MYTGIIVKLSLGILCLILQINLMGKGNLAPTSAMDQVQKYVLGGIIGGVIYNNDITVLQFFLVLVIWTFLVLSIKFIKNHNRFAKRLIDGKPVTLIYKGKILVNECMRQGISANDLSFKLRSAGIYEFSKVHKGILEQNGQLTISQYGEENVKYPLILEGQINNDVLEIIDKDDKWVAELLQQEKLELKDIYLGEYLSGQFIAHQYTE